MDHAGPSTNLSLAMTNGLRGRDEFGDAFTIQIEQAGELLVTSGWIVGCDPWLLIDAPQAYTTRVPQGRYPVLVSVAQSESRRFRWIACAQICLNELEVVRWEMAVRLGEDVSTLEPDQFFEYGVDSGTGCFLDLDVVAWVFEQAGVRDLEQWRTERERLSEGLPQEWQEEAEEVCNYFEEVVSEQVEIAYTSSGYGSVTFNEPTGGNLVMFQSGYGDGRYASYFGYAADGSLSCLITDFGVLSGAQWN